jgi:hypothetical protein
MENGKEREEETSKRKQKIGRMKNEEWIEINVSSYF